MRTTLEAVLVGCVIGVAGAGCATKGFVRKSVADVNTKVEALAQSIEVTQRQTKENASRIEQVDQKAGQAGSTAQTAQTSATAARAAADAATARAATVETSVKRLIFQVVISDDQGNFQPGKAELPDDVRAKLDELASKLKADQAGNYIEIEGHTDSRGTSATNDRLGLARAENVKRYLHETHQIPLHKMNVISFGESKPVAPNETREGRAQNRRVVIKVLS
jgi:outer membrane protein OmpA-like peptidoglycan-associated protein